MMNAVDAAMLIVVAIILALGLLLWGALWYFYLRKEFTEE